MVKISFIASGIILGLATISSASASLISRGFLDEALENYATTTALDLKANQSDFTALSNKIGTLPEGITLENFYKGWVDSGGESMAEYIATQGGKGMVYTYDPVNNYVSPVKLADVGYLDVLASLITQEGFTPAENSVLAPFYYLTKQAMRVGEIPNGRTAADMISEINTKTGMIDEINTKIGTLPSGFFPMIPGLELPFLSLNQPFTYPISLAELITAIYGNSETSRPGLLAAIITGFPFDTDGDGATDSRVGTLPNFSLATEAKELATTANTSATEAKELATTANTTATAAKTAADANTAKIGDLPTEYATVGAALTAMKSDIDAKNLPSTSDDGQYVLSAKKVGDTITYTWVKMDLTNEEQAQ